MMKLKMSPELSLPLDAVTQKIAFIGRTGSGKTYAATRLAEMFAGAGAQFVALDPVGKWWSLRLGADGKPSGFEIPVFGGLHGDLPLEPMMGARIADLIVDRQIAAVLDVSQFEHNTDKARFAEAFATRLFYRKKSSPSAIHLFVEEAQEFVPQNPQGEEKRMLGAFERLVKLGRNFGIGASLISQRPQEINKKALNQTECLFVFQTTGTHERKAIDAWIADKGIDEDIAALLPSLHVGEARVWSPAWLRASLTTKINAKMTFDASATPKVGAKKVDVKALTPIDIAEISKSLADVVEKAKADDPRELRRRIAELEKQLKAKPTETAAMTKEQARALEKTRELVEILRTEVAGLKSDGMFADLQELLGDCRADAASVVVRVDAAVARLAEVPPVSAYGIKWSGTQIPRIATVVVESPRARPTAAATRDVGFTGELPKGERAVLTAIAQSPNGATRDQISALTGYKRQTRDDYISRLTRKMFASVHGVGGSVFATQAGLDALGPSFEPLPTGAALVDHWRNRLPRGEWAILELLIGAWPDGLTRESVGESTGFKRQTRDDYISRLVRKKIVEKPQLGAPVRASEALMAHAR